MIYKRDPRFRRYGPAAAQNISYMPDSSFASGNAVNPTGDTLREVEKIPLPTRRMKPLLMQCRQQVHVHRPCFPKAASDEIILLFLIFILIAED